MYSDGAPRASAPTRNTEAGVPIVGIGASAGGLEALREMLAPAQMPTGMAFVVVQHLDPHHESMLAQLLDRATALEVLQCAGGERIVADTVYIIPPGRGLAIRDGVLELTEFQQPRGLRRPIDDFFLSLASDQQSNAACVILSGTGADGTTGLRAIKENGGVGVVQQPESARYDGMPLSAVGTGLIDFVKPAGEILECLQGFFQRRKTDPYEAEANVVADHVDDLCRVLRTAIGHDFSGYKRSTLIRRVERRMHVLGIDTGRAYLARIKSDSDECEALFRDLLINVTRFFRDPEAFETLRTRVIEPLLRERATDDELRVWVPGCSSGEEAYTIAMLFAEAARTLGAPLAVQIFATDIDEQMLTIAREGSYPASALVDLPPGMRERYVVPHAERFTVAASIRDMIRFSNHSLVKDPPFSRIDLISCRNLLIYFDDRLQQQVVPLFHYALRPGGYLFLGPSESVGRFEQLFSPVDQHARLYERAPGAPSYPIDLPGNRTPSTLRRDRDTRGNDSQALDRESVAIRRIVERYAPASLIVDQDGGILSAYGKLGRYFEFPVTRAGGSSAVNLARPGLRTVIGPLLRQARDERRRVVARDVAVETDYGTQPVEVICDPLGDATLLFVFRESGAFRPSDQDEVADLTPTDDHLEAIEDELRLTRHRLRAATEEMDTANEELKSSNEEMMSMNEELQSTNEELSTVNDELKSKVEQLTVAIADLRNFHQSTELAVVVLDADLRVRTYTEAALSIFPLQPSDRGRPISDVASRLQGTEYLDDARAVAGGAPATQRRVTTSDDTRVLSLRVLPYRTQSGKVDGATLVLTDITEALSLERQLAAERERLDLAIKAAGIGVWEYCPETGETVLDAVEQELFDLPGQRTTRIDPLLDQIEPDDRGAVETALRRAVERNGDFEATFRLRAGEVPRWIKGFGRVIGGSNPPRLLGVSIDVTSEYTLAETRDLMLREMNHRVKNLFAVIAGMVTVASRNHQDVRAFATDLRKRIAALGSAHSLASPAGQPQAIGLEALVEVTLAPYRDHSHVAVEGEPVALARSCLSSLALVLHEWATNSVKYGALRGTGEAGEADGSGLSVRWHVDADGLELIWEETGRADQDVAPRHRGFGSLLVETSVRQLRGEVGSEAAGRSFRLRIKLPMSVLASD